MAYVFSTNNLPADGNEAMFILKATMVAAGWTVLASGTGSAGAGSGVVGAGDLLTTPALMANSGSWFIMRSPAGAGSSSFGWQHYKLGVGFSQTWSTAFDPTSSWGAPTNPADIPSGPNTRWLMGDASSWVNFLPVPATFAWNVCCDNAAPYPLWASPILLGGGQTRMGLLFEAVTGAPPGDLRPYVAMVSQDSNEFGSGIYNGGINAPLGPWSVGAYDPALVSTTMEGCPGYYPSNNNGQIFSNNTTSNSVMNPITGKDELYPIIYGRVANSGATWQGFKGIGVMAFTCGTARAIGDTFSVNSPRDRIRLGSNLSLPWDGSVPVF
jgi:hypothetical protein